MDRYLLCFELSLIKLIFFRRSNAMGNSHSGKAGGHSGGGGMATAVQSNPNGQVQENPGGGSGPAVKGMSRTASGADLHDRAQAQYHPVDKLGKILAKKCDDERGINGVTGDVFAVSVFKIDKVFKLMKFFKIPALRFSEVSGSGHEAVPVLAPQQPGQDGPPGGNGLSAAV